MDKIQYIKENIIQNSVGVIWTTMQRSCIVCRWDTFTAAYNKGELVGLCADMTCRTKAIKED